MKKGKGLCELPSGGGGGEGGGSLVGCGGIWVVQSVDEQAKVLVKYDRNLQNYC